MLMRTRFPKARARRKGNEMGFCDDCKGKTPECYTCDQWTKGNLRDFFAGCALLTVGDRYSPLERSLNAYEVADAMLKAREEWEE